MKMNVNLQKLLVSNNSKQTTPDVQTNQTNGLLGDHLFEIGPHEFQWTAFQWIAISRLIF